MSLPPVILSIALAAAVAAQAPDRPPAGELARALQTKYDGIRDFTADFVHVYEGRALRRKATERGHVLVKKPGMMRWTYTAPEQKVFVSDGFKIYSHIPADRQVIVSDMPAEDRATTAVLFLTGKGNLTRDFAVSYADAQAGGSDRHALKLVPKRGGQDFDSLTLVVERATLKLAALSTQDAQGGTSTFTFTNLKENVGLSDKLFAFRIPRGTDVITSKPGS